MGTPPTRLGRGAQTTNLVLNLRGRRRSGSFVCDFRDMFGHVGWIERLEEINPDRLQSVDLHLHVPAGEGEIQSAERLLLRLREFTAQRGVRSVRIWTFWDGHVHGRLEECRLRLLAKWSRKEGLALYDRRFRSTMGLLAREEALSGGKVHAAA